LTASSRSIDISVVTGAVSGLTNSKTLLDATNVRLSSGTFWEIA
jgi:hypothetical protein